MYGIKYCEYVPEPSPVSSDYYVACHYYPGWGIRKNGYSDFKEILDFPERTPLLGFYDEANPECSDWQTKWAVEHGINCFVYCWYRRWDNLGQPVTNDGLFFCHQIDALKQSRYGRMIDFAIMWEADNAAGMKDEDDLLNNLLPFWVENYFTEPNYMKIDNKPVVFVYDWSFKFLNSFESPAKLKRALDKAREKIKEFGFDGMIFQVEYRYDNREVLQKYRDAGFDNTFAYCWHTEQRLPSQNEILERQMYLMRNHIEFDPYFAILTCSQAWDPYPWHRHKPDLLKKIVRWKLTPENWLKLLRDTKALADGLPDGALGKRLIMLDNWNEWCEGHYIAPHIEGGFKYLQAVREVFTHRDNLPDYRLPDTLGLGPYDRKIDLSASKEMF